MRLRVSHTTTYHYDEPVSYGLQQVRLAPKDHSGQNVLEWNTEIAGGRREVEFIDQHHNQVMLISMDAGAQEVRIDSSGIVETNRSDGIIGQHAGYTPLWYFRQPTALTQPGKLVRKLVSALDRSGDDDIALMHALSLAIAEAIRYQTGCTNSETNAEEALETGAGVCQDHAHVMAAAARHMGYAARYVSGYLMMNDRVEQDASHAWIEVYCGQIGWTGFDVSNGISPDERYIRVATGLDYAEAAPVIGMRQGQGGEKMQVEIQVQQ